MTDRRAFLTRTAGLVTLAATPGCALIFSGPKDPEDRSGTVLWGYVILDLVFVAGLVGIAFLIIDITSGAIYKRAEARPRPRPIDADEDELPDGEQLRTRPLMGQVIDVCPAAHDIARVPGARRFARGFGAHLKACPTCWEAVHSAPIGPVVALEGPFLAARATVELQVG